MADPIPTQYATEFSTNWIHRAQQSKARFDAFVEDIQFNGERKRFDRLQKQSSSLRTERKAPTPITDTSTDSRWCYRATYDLANTLAEEDARNLAPLVLPDSDYVKTHAMEYQRKCDLIAILHAPLPLFHSIQLPFDSLFQNSHNFTTTTTTNTNTPFDLDLSDI